MSKQEHIIDELKLEIEKLQAENSALLKLASHDMRSPLNKIFALVNLLKMSDDPLSAEQASYIETIEMILSDGLHRMRNLMDLRALENGQVTLHMEELDIASHLKRMVREYAPLAERKNIRISTELVSARTLTDKLTLTRVLDQLLSNALKFSPRNSEIKMQLTSVNDKIYLKVIDGGYGILENEQGLLFEKFSAISTLPTGGEAKTGLGLYIAMENVKKLGGIIRYSNDAGSTFTLELPLNSLA